MAKKEAIKKGYRRASDIKEHPEELTRFKRKYPMLSNEDMAKEFATSTEEVERLSHDLKIYKDISYTRAVTLESGGTGKKGNGVTPGYLVASLQRIVTEEERLALQSLYEEGASPEELLSDLAQACVIRVSRGMAIEVKTNQLYRVVNESVDSLHNILKTLHGMTEGNAQIHEIKGLNDLISRSKKNKE